MRLLLLAGLTAGLATAASFTYNDFSSVAGLSLTGDATQVGNVLRLVHDEPGLAGNAWYSTQIDISSGFATMFQFLVTTDPGDPTDGFSFIIQNDPNGTSALGGPGQGAGYAGLSPSVAVMFRGRAPAYIGAIVNGIDPLPGAPPDATAIAENEIYNQLMFAWIDYNSLSTTLRVYVSPTDVKPGTALMTTSLDIASILGGPAYVGLGAGTGGAFGNNDILSWSFATPEPVTFGTVPEPGTMGLYGLGLVATALLRRRFQK